MEQALSLHPTQAEIDGVSSAGRLPAGHTGLRGFMWFPLLQLLH